MSLDARSGRSAPPGLAAAWDKTSPRGGLAQEAGWPRLSHQPHLHSLAPPARAGVRRSVAEHPAALRHAQGRLRGGTAQVQVPAVSRQLTLLGAIAECDVGSQAEGRRWPRPLAGARGLAITALVDSSERGMSPVEGTPPPLRGGGEGGEGCQAEGMRLLPFGPAPGKLGAKRRLRAMTVVRRHPSPASRERGGGEGSLSRAAQAEACDYMHLRALGSPREALLSPLPGTVVPPMGCNGVGSAVGWRGQGCAHTPRRPPAPRFDAFRSAWGWANPEVVVYTDG
jgi:hypothetical protein